MFDNTVARAGRDIRERRPVDERWLYGKRANQLLYRGHVTIDDLKPYRDRFKDDLVEVQGEEKARARIADLGGDFDV